MGVLFQMLRLLAVSFVRKKIFSSISGIRLGVAHAYLRGLESVREAMILIFLLAVGLLLFILALTVTLVGFLIWVPWSVEAKALTLVGFGIVGLVSAVGLIFYAKSEQKWMRIFAVEEILSRLNK